MWGELVVAKDPRLSLTTVMNPAMFGKMLYYISSI